MQLQDLEQKRAEYHQKYKKALKVALIVSISWSVVGILFSVFALVSTQAPAIAYLFVIFFSLASALFPFTIIMVFFLLKNRRALAEYRSLYKTVFVEEALQEAFPGCVYEANAGIGEVELARLGMVNTGDIFHSEDLVTGDYHGLKFKQADVLIRERDEDSDGNTTYVTLFRGRWAIFDIKKNFDFKLAVVGKSFRVASLRNNDKLHKFRKIELESDGFHGRFNVYAQDGFEAFYLLDPAFMTRVEKLGEACQNRVALFFVGGELHIAVNNFENSFEAASMHKEIDKKAEIEKVKKDIRLITDIVDSLKLR